MSFAGQAGINPSIRLKADNAGLRPVEFFIQEVSDERQVKAGLAKLYTKEGNEALIRTVDLEGGAYPAIRKFIFQGLPGNAGSRPVIIRIKECSIQEKISGENQVNGQITLEFQFDLQKETGDVQLTRYRAAAKYSRPVNNIDVVEPSLRNLLVGSLKFFDSWMNKEASTNIILARGVKIAFTDYLDQHPDTVYYNIARPLTWTDFHDKPHPGKYDAAVFSAFGYDQERELQDGIIQVNLALKVYMIKSASWATHNIKDPYALNHEQRHFDIVKLVAERFKQKLSLEKLNPENYEGIINYEYLEFYREMNQQQKRYDLETGHGSNKLVQAQWNKSIDTDLAAIKNTEVL